MEKQQYKRIISIFLITGTMIGLIGSNIYLFKENMNLEQNLAYLLSQTSSTSYFEFKVRDMNSGNEIILDNVIDLYRINVKSWTEEEIYNINPQEDMNYFTTLQSCGRYKPNWDYMYYAIFHHSEYESVEFLPTLGENVLYTIKSPETVDFKITTQNETNLVIQVIAEENTGKLPVYDYNLEERSGVIIKFQCNVDPSISLVKNIVGGYDYIKMILNHTYILQITMFLFEDATINLDLIQNALEVYQVDSIEAYWGYFNQNQTNIVKLR